MLKLLYIAVTTFALTIGTKAQGTLSITFDGPPYQPPGSSFSVQAYEEAGMLFRPIGATGPGNTFSRRGEGGLFVPNNGSAYVAAAFTESFGFRFEENTLFNLVSIDLGEYSTAFPEPFTVPFIGYRPNGSSVSVSFTIDGIIDGPGPLADFQTFHFGPEFSGLTHVEIPSYGWSLDNLVVSVPEPSSGLLLLVVGGVFWLVRRLRGRSFP